MTRYGAVVTTRDRLTHHRVTCGGTQMSVAEALARLTDDEAFRAFVNDALARSAFATFRWETPPLTRATASRPFEFVVIDAPELAGRAPDARAFAEHFDDDADVVTFANLGGDATLVAPTPRTEPAACVDLAAFVRGAPADARHALWREVATAVTRRLGYAPLWLNTAGDGVAWLHVRLDARPKYYRHADYAQLPR